MSVCRSPRQSCDVDSSRIPAIVPPCPGRTTRLHKLTADEIRRKYQIQAEDRLELLLMKKEAEECYNYQKAKCIQILIDDATSATETLVNDFKDWLRNILTDSLRRLNVNIGVLLEHRDKTELEIRQAMTRALNEIQTRHITALVAIEVKRTTAHSRIEEREIAGYNAAVAQSRRLAADDQPDMAQKVLNNARDEVARQRGQMHSREDDKYDHLVETEAARQTAELNGWQTNLDSQVELIHTTCNVGIQGEYKKMMVFVQRSLHRAINHTCREIKTKSLHQWVATALTQFTRHLLDLEKCGFLLPLE